MVDELSVKESAVKEKRIWVRVNRVCNNGCLFCLDSDIHDGFMESREAVEEKIRRGREEGGERLILSGGEASLHPDFVHFIEFGRAQGYRWIQTITNGRMYAYRKFADRVVAAGLNETTFSMHGHHADLHDRLVGVPGAFKQAFAGLQNLVGRIVVNIDVVLNQLNIPHLHDILEFYMAMGIHEFDLLHMVPFGRAWRENRELLFFDPVEMMPHLSLAFELRHRPGIYMWTNRLPAPFLEGNEDLIQDPHKLHDEVRGRREMFEEWRDLGTEPVCQGDRCGYCPMEGFCGSLRKTLADLKGTSCDSVTCDADHLAFLDLYLPRLKAAGGGVSFVSSSPEDTLCYVGQFPERISTSTLVTANPAAVLQQSDAGGFAQWVIDSLEGASPEVVAAFCRRGGEVTLPFENGIDDFLSRVPASLREQVTVRAVPRLFVSDSRRLDPPLSVGLLATVGEVVGMPICLSGKPTPEEREVRVDLRLMNEEGKLDLALFTDWFVLQEYRVKSLRCASCAGSPRCEGLHINAVRNYGLGVLVPFEED